MIEDELEKLEFWRDLGVEMSMEEDKEIQNKILPYENLKELRNALDNPGICDLQKTAHKTVFCDGNPDADVMIFGEAPGKNEDLEGVPFCGRSGELLDRMLEAIDFDRSHVYTTNPVFWRPPENRKPTLEEIACCAPFVKNHIALIQPKVILLLGSTAIFAILGIENDVSKVRGKIHYYQNEFFDQKIPVIPTFHPAYLLRQPEQRKVAWQDILLLQKVLKKL